MFELAITLCLAGSTCYAGDSPISYESAQRCLDQGAIISSIMATQLARTGTPSHATIECQIVGLTVAMAEIVRNDGRPPEAGIDRAQLEHVDISGASAPEEAR